MDLHFLEFHATNPFSFWGPSLALNLHVFSMMALEKSFYVLSAWFIIRYLRKFYGERPVPKEWMVFWWAFAVYSLHEVVEMIALYQWIHGEIFWLFFFTIEISAAVLLTWGCYLLVKTYVLKK